MSGIAGLVELDGAPIDRALIERMTDFQRFRRPNGSAVWADGSVGLGHTLLKTTDEAEHETQPCSLDGRVWITADARVDGRSDLIDRLRGRGREVGPAATDPELILHAYHSWDEGCIEHLLGDFSFAIWDGPRRRLFCAVDHWASSPSTTPTSAAASPSATPSTASECTRKSATSSTRSPLATSCSLGTTRTAM